MLGCILALSTSASWAPAAAQSERAGLPFEIVPLEDLSAFDSPGANWRVVGAVSADLRREHHLDTSAGAGMLANLPAAGRETNLFTEWQHGDLELELDVLMPRGSNSGIYLQGRYEVQLLDSWGVRTPTFADAAGIYERWDESRPDGARGYEGHAPRVNASRAPGLWQTLRILFRAPRFDDAGNKTANARFVRVVHNGVVVHENVDVTRPTRAAAFQDEQPLGPLMFQGDHGPVAFRNIRYKRYTGERLHVSGLRYGAAEGEFSTLGEAMSQTLVREGTADGISSVPAGVPNEFVLKFDGTLSVPVSGVYVFELGFDWVDADPQFGGTVVGGGRLVIGGHEVLVHDGIPPSAAGEASLEAGDRAFSLTFYKNRPWTNRTGVSLLAEGPGIERHALHDLLATRVELPATITVEPGAEALVLRGFVSHDDVVHTHAASVGDAEGVHYAYDLGQAALLYAWRGPFVEAADMWHSRGERQLALPQGSVVGLSGAPPLAFLDDASAPWPDSVPAALEYRAGGYTLDEAGRPTFLYRVHDIEVEDRVRPAEDGGALHRELHLRGADATEGLHVRLAAADRIDALGDGLYVIGDRAYYIAPERGEARPFVRSLEHGDELILPVRFRRGEARLAYTIIW